MLRLMPNRKRVLLVDDEEEICATLKLVLEEEGYAVDVAQNGVQALELLRRVGVKPGVIILDLLMPLMDGNAVYSALKADTGLRDIPVVITTSDPARAPGGAAVVKKPFSLASLLEIVRKRC